MITSSSKEIAVVTGSSKGIGRAIVLAFAGSREYKGYC
jgi:NAD(P)-dependent dehydrogenase (short-subunit alcohol dehydrogenase family)